jgi:hypothetical protein
MTSSRREPPEGDASSTVVGTRPVRWTSSIHSALLTFQEYFHMHKIVALLLLFAVGVSMIVNGCGTLLQVLP